MNNIIIKVGGSILEDPDNLSCCISQFNTLFNDFDLFKNIIIITGGGSFANFIRYVDNQLKLGDDLAHWLAIYAMDYNAEFLNKKYPNIKFCRDFYKLKESLNDKKRHFIVFASKAYLFENDELPHNWNVTSDSITLFLAYKLQMNECYLIKNIDGIFLKGTKEIVEEISISELKKVIDEQQLAIFDSQNQTFKHSQPIDSYSLELMLKNKTNCIFLNGSKGTNRILDYFSCQNQEKKNLKLNRKYTRIHSD